LEDWGNDEMGNWGNDEMGNCLIDEMIKGLKVKG
jgi:hypothetical protein